MDHRVKYSLGVDRRSEIGHFSLELVEVPE